MHIKDLEPGMGFFVRSLDDTFSDGFIEGVVTHVDVELIEDLGESPVVSAVMAWENRLEDFFLSVDPEDGELIYSDDIGTEPTPVRLSSFTSCR